MTVILYLIPLFTILSGFLIYRLNGRREFLQLDLIQFCYTFILAPLFLIWAKTFIFFLLRSEVNARLSVTELFTIDTAFSLFLFYMYAFIVMHSLTKTFRLNTEKDPLYDLFHHSEYIHLWLTHIATSLGVLVLLVVLGLVNVFFPLALTMSKTMFYLVCVGGSVMGNIGFVALWLTDPRQAGRRYLRLMKVAIGVLFVVLTTVYFVVNPSFTASFSLFWFVFFAFSTMLVWSFFTYRSHRVFKFLEHFASAHKDTELWGVNSQLFSMSDKPKVKG